MTSQSPRPSPSIINDRVAVVDRAIRNEFPDVPCQIARGFHHVFLQRKPMGLGRPRLAMSRLRVRVPKRNIVPLSVNEVSRFWPTFRTVRDLAIVGLMLLQGLRSADVLALNRDAALLSKAQLRVRVPLGKLKTERMVPVDSFVCELVLRLQFFCSLDPLPADGRLLARPRSKEALVRQLRDYLHQVCHALGLPIRIVPHQCRHSYATEILRAGVGFPAVMKLLAHTSPEMTMLYLDVAADLQREFQVARSKPRHLVPQPKTPFTPRAASML